MIQMNKILVPVDGSRHSAKGVKYALELKQKFGSEVTLLMVIDDQTIQYIDCTGVAENVLSEVSDGMIKKSEQELNDFAQEVIGDLSLVTTRVVQGHTYTEIIEFAKSSDTDLIVMTTHGRTGLSHILLGSIAEKVVQLSPCPVLTVKVDAKDLIS